MSEVYNFRTCSPAKPQVCALPKKSLRPAIVERKVNTIITCAFLYGRYLVGVRVRISTYIGLMLLFVRIYMERGFRSCHRICVTLCYIVLLTLRHQGVLVNDYRTSSVKPELPRLNCESHHFSGALF